MHFDRASRSEYGRRFSRRASRVDLNLRLAARNASARGTHGPLEHGIGETTTAYEADLGWIVKLTRVSSSGGTDSPQEGHGCRKRGWWASKWWTGVSRGRPHRLRRWRPKGHQPREPAPSQKEYRAHLPSIRLAEPGARLNIDIRGKMVAARSCQRHSIATRLKFEKGNTSMAEWKIFIQRTIEFTGRKRFRDCGITDFAQH
jgi:hypothetical protein